jgi:hypothetical protein
MAKQQSSTTPRQKFGMILFACWIVLGFVATWQQPLFVVFLFILMILYFVLGRKFTVCRIAFFVLGIAAFASLQLIPESRQYLTWHKSALGIEIIYYQGISVIFAVAKTTTEWKQLWWYMFYPPLVSSLVLFAGAQLVFKVLHQESAEEKLIKAAVKAGHKEPRKVSFDKLDYRLAGVPLGANLWDKGRPAYLPFGSLNKHVALVGTTGSGKTVTVYNFVISALMHKKAIVFIDGKGDSRNVEKFVACCRRSGRSAQIVTLDGSGRGYNPIGAGTPTELADKLIQMFDWSEEHYRLGSQRFAQILIKFLQIAKIPVNLNNIIKFSELKQLELAILPTKPTKPAKPKKPQSDGPSFDSADQGAAESGPGTDVQQPDELTDLYNRLKSIDPRSISGFRDRLATLAESDLSTTFQAPDALNLSEAIESGEAVLLSLDSLRYPALAKSFGRLVVNDIKSAVSVHMRSGARPVSLIFDEFNVFASHEVVDIINKSRSAGFEALLSFQSLSDIDKLNQGEALRRQIIQNCNSLIVQLQNDAHDAEELAALFGTAQTTALTIQEDSLGGAGAGSRRLVHEYKVHPDWIKYLQTGQAFVKFDGGMVTKIQIVNN